MYSLGSIQSQEGHLGYRTPAACPWGEGPGKEGFLAAQFPISVDMVSETEARMLLSYSLDTYCVTGSR